MIRVSTAPEAVTIIAIRIDARMSVFMAVYFMRIGAELLIKKEIRFRYTVRHSMSRPMKAVTRIREGEKDRNETSTTYK